MIVTDSRGRRFLPVTVSIDEPELHLHPYLQRAMLAFCRSILNNEEPFFLKLVQTILGVDGLRGQLFVVTHSTDSLVNDYRQIIRIYWDDRKKVQAACGASFHFDREIEKHLIMHFPEVKEALYSKCTILVEGETEYGSFGYFAKTLGVNFDYHAYASSMPGEKVLFPKLPSWYGVSIYRQYVFTTGMSWGQPGSRPMFFY